MRYVVESFRQLIRPSVSMRLSAACTDTALAGEWNRYGFSAFLASVGPIALVGIAAVEHLLHLRDRVAGDVWVLTLVSLPTFIG